MPDSLETRIAKCHISLWICWWFARLGALVSFPLLSP
jgi:hypothetical protein